MRATDGEPIRPHAHSPIRAHAKRQTPNADTLKALPNQPPEFLFVHNPHIERARFLQLAAGLFAS
jgi:hypothetical protein